MKENHEGLFFFLDLWHFTLSEAIPKLFFRPSVAVDLCVMTVTLSSVSQRRVTRATSAVSSAERAATRSATRAVNNNSENTSA